MSKRTFLIIGALVVAAGLGWMLKRHVDRSAIVALVKDTGARLHEALALEAGPPAAESTQKLDGHAAAAEKNRTALKRLDAAGRQALMDAADDYLLTGQEILRRQAAAHRTRLLLAESLKVLRGHFRADRGAGSWVKEAVRLREQVEKHYGDYSIAAETFDKLLESLPASQAKVAPLVSDLPVAEGNLIEDARKRSQEALKRATSEVEGSRRLDR